MTAKEFAIGFTVIVCWLVLLFVSPPVALVLLILRLVYRGKFGEE